MLLYCLIMAMTTSLCLHAQPAPRPLRVLSWNIYMLPKFARITGKRQRAHHIVEQVGKGDYDVIVFQEAFLGDARRINGRGLRREFPYQYGPANRKFSIKTNSGIWVLSRDSLHPIEEVDYVECDMVATLDAEDGPLTIQLDSVATGYANDLHSNGIRSFRIIDFAFYRANGRPPASIHRFMPRLAAEWSKKHRDLSDHFPVVLEVGW